jgi:BirA family transcriptional regulator, biotin operon repressor / biotin---[acetyl-CoA-carboxylase] ligase
MSDKHANTAESTALSLDSPIEFHLPSVSSTNDYAKELLISNNFVFVSALHQTKGRGRKGRVWHGDFGANVYCSFGIRHHTSPSSEELAMYMAKSSLAVLKVVKAALPGKDVQLKYPNDVGVVQDRQFFKISGSLVEHEFQGSSCECTIVGIGLNVDQLEFSDTIDQPCTSLRLSGAQVDLREAIQSIKDSFCEYHSMSINKMFDLWRGELNIIGRRLRISSESGLWVVSKVMKDGRLLVINTVSNNERMISDADTIRYED